jgi:hypothetical protein
VGGTGTGSPRVAASVITIAAGTKNIPTDHMPTTQPIYSSTAETILPRYIPVSAVPTDQGLWPDGSLGVAAATCNQGLSLSGGGGGGRFSLGGDGSQTIRR